MWEWFAMNLVKDGYLIIDDTIWQRYGKQLEGVSYVWDSTISKKVFGTNVVLLIWTDRKRRIQLGLLVWQKDGKLKENQPLSIDRQRRRKIFVDE
jgi:DDE superfamily endonuclease